MAQFLMLAKDIAHAGRLSGDPVTVVDDAHVFSENEDKRVWLANGNAEGDWEGLFEVIVITGMPVSIARRLYEDHIRAANLGDPEWNSIDEADRIVTLGPHRWQLGKQDRLPPPLANKLGRDGFVEVPYDIPTLNNYIVDRQGLDVFITDTPIRM